MRNITGTKKATFFTLGYLFANLASVFFSDTQDSIAKPQVSYSQRMRPRVAMVAANLCFLLYSVVKINEMYRTVTALKNTIPDESAKITRAALRQDRTVENFFPENPDETNEIERGSGQLQNPSKRPLYVSYLITSVLYFADQTFNVTLEINESPYLSLLGATLFCATHIYYAHKLRSNINQLNQATQQLSAMKDIILNPPNGLPVNVRMVAEPLAGGIDADAEVVAADSADDADSDAEVVVAPPEGDVDIDTGECSRSSKWSFCT